MRPRGVEIDRLSADHAGHPGGLGNQRDRRQLSRCERPVGIRGLAREERERLGQQAVPGENRHALAELHV